MVWKELQGGPTTTQSWFNLHKLSGLCRLTTVRCWMDSMILFKEISHCMLFCDSLIHIYNTGGQLTLLRVEKIFSAILIFSNAFEEWKAMRRTSKWNRDGRYANVLSHCNKSSLGLIFLNWGKFESVVNSNKILFSFDLVWPLLLQMV